MKVFKENEQFNTSGSSLSGYINATYKQLSTILGEPTFSTPSGDNKTQKEWVVKFEGNLFTIYDWKTYDVEYTINELDRFNIGSKVNSEKFIKILEKLLEEGY